MQGKQVLLTGATGGLGLGVTPLVLAQGAASLTIPYRNYQEALLLEAMLGEGRIFPAPKGRGVVNKLPTMIAQFSEVASVMVKI